MKSNCSFLRTLFSFLLLSLFLSGCFIRPYKFDVTQGNIFRTENLAQLQPGMTTEQVTYLLGAPVLRDIFHPERWNYVYYEKTGQGKTSSKEVVVYFKEGRVTKIYQAPKEELVT